MLRLWRGRPRGEGMFDHANRVLVCLTDEVCHCFCLSFESRLRVWQRMWVAIVWDWIPNDTDGETKLLLMRRFAIVVTL